MIGVVSDNTFDYYTKNVIVLNIRAITNVLFSKEKTLDTLNLSMNACHCLLMCLVLHRINQLFLVKLYVSV